MNSNKLHIISVFLLLLVGVVTMTAQRRITPVEPQLSVPKQESTEIDKSRLAHMHDANGNIVLVDTVTGMEFRDSLGTSVPKMIYPLMYRVHVGVNIWDGLMRLVGQKYGAAGVWGELNLHNRYFPYFEIGLGCADDTPQNGNYTYKSPLAPYFKLGATYNIFYNSNPDYQLCLGLTYGFSPFKFNVSDIKVDDRYWGEESIIEIPSQSVTAGYLEVSVGVKVRIVDRFYMGWRVMYHSILHESKCAYGEPMYIPGFGKRNGSIAAALSAIWTFDLNKQKAPAVDNE